MKKHNNFARKVNGRHKAQSLSPARAPHVNGRYVRNNLISGEVRHEDLLRFQRYEVHGQAGSKGQQANKLKKGSHVAPVTVKGT